MPEGLPPSHGSLAPPDSHRSTKDESHTHRTEHSHHSHHHSHGHHSHREHGDEEKPDEPAADAPPDAEAAKPKAFGAMASLFNRGSVAKSKLQMAAKLLGARKKEVLSVKQPRYWGWEGMNHSQSKRISGALAKRGEFVTPHSDSLRAWTRAPVTGISRKSEGIYSEETLLQGIPVLWFDLEPENFCFHRRVVKMDTGFHFL